MIKNDYGIVFDDTKFRINFHLFKNVPIRLYLPEFQLIKAVIVAPINAPFTVVDCGCEKKGSYGFFLFGYYKFIGLKDSPSIIIIILLIIHKIIIDQEYHKFLFEYHK